MYFGDENTSGQCSVICLLRGKCSDLLLSFEELDGLLNQLDECFVVFGDGSWLIAG